METKALVCLPKLIEKKIGELQLNCLMTVMEFAAVAEANADLIQVAFKLNSPAARVILEQLLRVFNEENSPQFGRCLKDRREKKKEDTRAHNAQLHAAVSVAGVVVAVVAIAAATIATSASGKDEQMTKTDMAIASAATLVAVQYVEAAESMGAERDHLTAAINSAVNVRSHDDILTLTAASAIGTFVLIDPVKSEAALVRSFF